MIWLLIIASFMVAWVAASYLLYSWDSEELPEAVMFGFALALIWPLALVGYIVSRIVVRMKEERDAERISEENKLRLEEAREYERRFRVPPPEPEGGKYE